MSLHTLAGEFGSALLLSIATTAILAPLALWHYAATVMTGMAQRAGPELPLPAVPPAAADPRHVQAPEVRPEWQRRAERRAAAAWSAAFGACALLLAAAEIHFDDGDWAPVQVAARVTIHWTAAVPMVAFVLGWTLRQSLLRTLIAMAASATVTLVVALMSHALSDSAPPADALLVLPRWFLAAAAVLWLPALVLLVTATARVRGVVPLIFAVLLWFGAALFLAPHVVSAMARTEAGSAALLQWAMLQSRHLWFALLVLPFGALAIWRLSAVARAYAARRVSDLDLLARCWWWNYCALAALPMLADAPQRPAGPLACLLVAAALGPASRITLRWARTQAPPPRTLLVLRVFGFRRRTEQLVDRIVTRWRFQGPVTMIAAPDVTARTLDAVDFVQWLLGRDQEAFVRDAHELRRRVAGIDVGRGTDGRFRITELCCNETAWRAAVVELMDRADAVVMDLRGLRAGREGCEFELAQLAQRVEPARVVLVVEPGADRAAIDRVLGATAGSVTFVELADRTGADTSVLYARLLQACEAHPPAAARPAATA